MAAGLYSSWARAWTTVVEHVLAQASAWTASLTPTANAERPFASRISGWRFTFLGNLSRAYEFFCFSARSHDAFEGRIFDCVDESSPGFRRCVLRRRLSGCAASRDLAVRARLRRAARKFRDQRVDNVMLPRAVLHRMCTGRIGTWLICSACLVDVYDACDRPEIAYVSAEACCRRSLPRRSSASSCRSRNAELVADGCGDHAHRHGADRRHRGRRPGPSPR